MKNYGNLTAHAIGAIMKEMTRRAMEAIIKERLSFELKITEKESAYKDGQDFLTSADTAAQQVYLKMIKECFPSYGIIAEEDNLIIPAKNNQRLFFTVDPLDGTKAFIRRQSHAISTMISLCTPNKFIAAAIGDVMTGEIYYFRPESDNVHRLHNFQISEKLTYQRKPLSEQYILFREDFRDHINSIQRLVSRQKGMFKSMEIEGGSIGTMFARLWKGEVGAIALPKGTTTPWDANPIFAISKKLGFVPVCFTADRPLVLDFGPLTENTPQHESIIIHRSHLEQIEKYFER